MCTLLTQELSPCGNSWPLLCIGQKCKQESTEREIRWRWWSCRRRRCRKRWRWSWWWCSWHRLCFIWWFAFLKVFFSKMQFVITILHISLNSFFFLVFCIFFYVHFHHWYADLTELNKVTMSLKFCRESLWLWSEFLKVDNEVRGNRCFVNGCLQRVMYSQDFRIVCIKWAQLELRPGEKKYHNPKIIYVMSDNCTDKYWCIVIIIKVYLSCGFIAICID